jgi:hypothetical protein
MASGCSRALGVEVTTHLVWEYDREVNDLKRYIREKMPSRRDGQSAGFSNTPNGPTYESSYRSTISRKHFPTLISPNAGEP